MPAGFSPGTGVGARGGTGGNAELGRGDERGWQGGSGGVIGFGARLALWFYRGACCRFAPGVAVLAGRFALARVRRCVSVAALRSRAFGGAFLLPRCPRARLASRSCHGVTLARGWHCGSGGAVTFGVRLSSLFYCGDLPSVHACLFPLRGKRDGLRCLAFLFRRVEIAIRAFSRCRCGYLAWQKRGAGLRGDALSVAALALDLRSALRFCWGVCLRFTPAVCRMATNRTACGGLRSYSAGSRSPFARSRCVGAVICLGGFTSGLDVSLWRSRRGCRDAGNGGRGWRRGLYASLRGRIGFAALSAGSTLGLRAPNLRQRVFDSLDSLHAAAGLCWCVFATQVRITARCAGQTIGIACEGRDACAQ